MWLGWPSNWVLTLSCRQLLQTVCLIRRWWKLLVIMYLCPSHCGQLLEFHNCARQSSPAGDTIVVHFCDTTWYLHSLVVCLESCTTDQADRRSRGWLREKRDQSIRRSRRCTFTHRVKSQLSKLIRHSRREERGAERMRCWLSIWSKDWQHHWN